MLHPDRLQVTVYYGAFALHAGYLRLNTHTHTHTKIRNTSCFFHGAKMGTQTCLSVTFICTLPVLLGLKCLTTPSYSDNIATLLFSQTRIYFSYTVACKFGYTWMLLEGSSLVNSVVMHSVCVLRKLKI